MKKNKILRVILIILIIIWAILVFGLSSQNGTKSSNLSQGIAGILVKDSNIKDIAELYIRKIAHFMEYSLGGILFISLFYTYDWSERRKIITSILLGVWYAVMDELHQLLVEGRHGGIEDVWIDSLGIMTGIVRNADINKDL